MAKNLPTKARAELDKYKRGAALARGRAKAAPMATAKTGMSVAIGAAAGYGALRTQVPIFDSGLAEAVTAAGLALYGIVTGTPTALHAASGIGAVAAHNAAEDMLSAVPE